MRQLFAIAIIVLFSSCINQRVDLVVHHAQIYTVNNDFSMAEAMAIQDGKIVAIGTNDDILKERIQISISEAVEFWLPYIGINELNIQTVVAVDGTREEHGITISMKVSVNDIPSETPITFLVTTSGVAET